MNTIIEGEENHDSLRSLARDPALSMSSEEASKEIANDPAASEMLLRIVQLDSGGLRILAEFSQEMAEDEARGSRRRNPLEMAETLRRRAAHCDAVEQSHG